METAAKGMNFYIGLASILIIAVVLLQPGSFALRVITNASLAMTKLVEMLGEKEVLFRVSMLWRPVVALALVVILWNLYLARLKHKLKGFFHSLKGKVKWVTVGGGRARNNSKSKSKAGSGAGTSSSSQGNTSSASTSATGGTANKSKSNKPSKSRTSSSSSRSRNSSINPNSNPNSDGTPHAWEGEGHGCDFSFATNDYEGYDSHSGDDVGQAMSISALQQEQNYSLGVDGESKSEHMKSSSSPSSSSHQQVQKRKKKKHKMVYLEPAQGHELFSNSEATSTTEDADISNTFFADLQVSHNGGPDCAYEDAHAPDHETSIGRKVGGTGVSTCEGSSAKKKKKKSKGSGKGNSGQPTIGEGPTTTTTTTAAAAAVQENGASKGRDKASSLVSTSSGSSLSESSVASSTSLVSESIAVESHASHHAPVYATNNGGRFLGNRQNFKSSYSSAGSAGVGVPQGVKGAAAALSTEKTGYTLSGTASGSPTGSSTPKQKNEGFAAANNVNTSQQPQQQPQQQHHPNAPKPMHDRPEDVRCDPNSYGNAHKGTSYKYNAIAQENRMSTSHSRKNPKSDGAATLVSPASLSAQNQAQKPIPPFIPLPHCDFQTEEDVEELFIPASEEHRVAELTKFLEAISLKSSYLHRFKERRVSLFGLACLADKELAMLGVPPNDRLRMAQGLKGYKVTPISPKSSPPASSAFSSSSSPSSSINGSNGSNGSNSSKSNSNNNGSAAAAVKRANYSSSSSNYVRKNNVPGNNGTMNKNNAAANLTSSPSYIQIQNGQSSSQSSSQLPQSSKNIQRVAVPKMNPHDKAGASSFSTTPDTVSAHGIQHSYSDKSPSANTIGTGNGNRNGNGNGNESLTKETSTGGFRDSMASNKVTSGDNSNSGNGNGFFVVRSNHHQQPRQTGQSVTQTAEELEYEMFNIATEMSSSVLD